jgi:serine/threonine protein kinase
VIAERFHLLGRLGRGGIADVFAAHDDHTGDRVALKLLPAYGDHAAVTRARVEAEMTLSRSVTHPNVCRVIETGHTGDGRAFIVTEALAGETLGQCLRRRRRISIEGALALAREAARGLGALHRVGIVHLDVKPDNLFLCDGKKHDVPVKIIDFGFAAREGAIPEEPLKVFGTLRYTAPEQVVGEPADARADIYSLGVVLFRAITGELPFDGCSDRDLVVHHLGSPLPPPSWLRDDVSPEVDAVVACAVRKHPRNRYSTMAAFCSDLDRVLHGRAINGAPAPVLPDSFTPATEDGRRVVKALIAAA